jgi:hypothetical protein
LKAGDQELSMAQARRETVTTELQAAVNRVKEAEALLQSLQQEVVVAKLDMQEAEEHIGWVREFVRQRKLQRESQAPTFSRALSCPPSSPPSSPPSVTSDILSHTSLSSRSEGTSEPDCSCFISSKMNGAKEGLDDAQGTITSLTEASLKRLNEEASN